MRVLHVFKTYLPDTFGGIERVIWELAQGTSAMGFENHVLHLSRAPSVSPDQVGLHFSHRVRPSLEIASTPVSLSILPKFRSLAAGMDVIHYHFPWPMMDVLHLAYGVSKPSVVTYHSDIVRQKNFLRIYSPLMHRFLDRVDAIVATSPNYLASSPVLNRFREKTKVIPIGIAPGTVGVSDAQRRAYWIGRLPPRFFLFIGVPRYYKGLSYLLEAAKVTGFPVVMAGAGHFPADLMAKAGPDVVVLGEVSDDDRTILLDLCEAFILPSHLRSEAFGVALLEAAFAGKALVSCEIGTGTTYVNQHGVTGLAVPPQDVQALAEAMRTLWNDAALSARYGKAARERARKLFRSDTMVSAYARLYQDVVEKRTGCACPASQPVIAENS